MPAIEVASSKNSLLRSVAVVLCLSFAPASAQQAITTPILQSGQNFRDLAGIAAPYGGTGYAETTSHNGVMRTGVFYRSEALSVLSNADLATLSKLKIGLDIDLRTRSEIAGPPTSMDPNNGPDRVPAGATFVNVNIYGTYAPPPLQMSSVPAAIASMVLTYQNFVIDPGQRAAFRTVLLDLANEPSAALYHCSGGKDRTGWTSTLLQTIAGAPQATIMRDYLATNSYMAVSIQEIKNLYPSSQWPIIQALAGVKPQYLQAALDQAIASYGSMNAYLTEGLGLSQADIYVLRAKMVYYLTLPGQSGYTGNAAAGAAFLNALQNSPLSGHYTAYNYYLQSALDAGALGGVETQVGGQVHADAASYLLRQPLWIDEAIAPYTNSRDLRDGQGRIWLAALGGSFGSERPCRHCQQLGAQRRLGHGSHLPHR